MWTFDIIYTFYKRVKGYCKEPPTRSRISEVIFC